MKTILRFISVMAVTMSFVLTAAAQGSGNLKGSVKDASGEYLPGAAVIVKDANRGTSTDLSGYYLLQGIPAGKAEVLVSYLGYEDQVVPVTIKAGSTATLDVVLTELTSSIEQVTVTAVIDGQQRALNQQRTADNQMLVLSADQIGLFPDLNVADALKRVSGIASDGITITLRGTPGNFTSINFNGEQLLGTGENGIRAMEIDQIPSDVLSSMEVQKTLLPSNDGDAIGGVINLRAAEARSLSPRFKVDAGPGYNFLRGKLMYNGKFSYEQRFHATDANPHGVFGVAARLSYFNSYNGYDRIDANNWLEKSVNMANGETEKMYMPTDFRYRYLTNHSRRGGASLVLDYAPTVNTKIVFTGNYNTQDVAGERNRNRERFRGSFWQLDPAQYGNHAFATDRASEVVQYTPTDEKKTTWNAALNAETVLGNWKLDLGGSYSHSVTEYTSMAYGFTTPDYRANKKAINGTGDPAMLFAKNTQISYVPDITSNYLQMLWLAKTNGATEGSLFNDAEDFALTTVERWDHTQTGRNITAHANVSFNHSLGNAAATLSFGVKDKLMLSEGFCPDGGNDTYSYSFPKNKFATDALRMNHFVLTPLGSDHFLNGNMNYTYMLDPAKLSGLNYKELMTINSNASNCGVDAYYYSARENILAGYLMEKIQWDRLMMIVGARVEANTVSYKANTIFEYDADVDLSVNPSGQDPANLADEEVGPQYTAYTKTPNSKTIPYIKVLPNVQFKYDFNRNTLVRLAYTTGYARPDIDNLVPKVGRNSDAGIITQGNPDLKPAYSHNFDLIGEHYMSNVGLISVGAFYKHIDNFIYLSQETLASTSQYAYANSPFSLMRMSRNGETAKIYGVEVTLNSALTFLPGFLKNLVFTSNYTFVHSDALVQRMDAEDASVQAVSEHLRLPGQADHTFNAALAYSTKRFSLQAAYNYIGAYIMSLGANSDMDVWLSGRGQLDVNGSVNIVKGLSFYVEAQNVTNARKFQYMGDMSRVYEVRFMGPTARCGFTYKF